jgi:P27 family predicted phage terminase small subunit
MPRIPKPTALEALEGNPRQHTINRFEAQFDHVIPKCPGHLSRSAKKYYCELAAVLYRARILTEADQIVLANLAQAYATLAQAQSELNQSKLTVTSQRGGPRVSPLFRIVNQSMLTITKLSQELGLTPLARARLRIDKKATSSDMIDDAVFHQTLQRFA